MLQSKILNHYEKHSCTRICQGDILRDMRFRWVDGKGEVFEYEFPYLVVVSQDCDLQHSFNEGEPSSDSINNQFLPNVLLLPAFVAEQAKEGEHLKKVFGIKQERKDSARWRPIKQNRNDRYHLLSQDKNLQIPELLIDFKIYYDLPMKVILQTYKECYLATINELFREDLSRRFTNYLSRIGLPELGQVTPVQEEVQAS